MSKKNNADNSWNDSLVWGLSAEAVMLLPSIDVTCGLFPLFPPDGVYVVKPQRFRQCRGQTDFARHVQVTPRPPLFRARLSLHSFLLRQLAPWQVRHLYSGPDRRHCRRVAPCNVIRASVTTTDVIGTWQQISGKRWTLRCFISSPSYKNMTNPTYRLGQHSSNFQLVSNKKKNYEWHIF